jgi:Polyketide cyclase / dehydrase and lipid transport
MITRNLSSSEPRPVTAQVRIFIARMPEVAFDYFADLRNEPQYNRQVSGITKTSPGPVGQDTRFEGSHRGLGHVTWRLSEYERPEHDVIEGNVGQGAYRWTSDFEAAEGGTWMTGRMEWLPPRRWRPFRRLLGAILHWNARRSFRHMAEVLQRGGSPTG